MSYLPQKKKQTPYGIYLSIIILLVLSFSIEEYFSFQKMKERTIESHMESSKLIRDLMMSVRRVYQKQFIDSGMELNEKTIGFLPAHSMSYISKAFKNWNSSGVSFNNISDQPRNFQNQADSDELKVMAFFRKHKDKESFTSIIEQNGTKYFHYTEPIWVEQYCLKCHGAKESAPSTIQALYKTSYNYSPGDLRGLLSIKIPQEILLIEANENFLTSFAYRLFLFTLILSTIIILLYLYFKQRLRAENNLFFQHQKLDLLLKGMNVGLWDWNLKENKVSFDEAWIKMLGYELPEIEQNLDFWRSLIHPDDLDQYYIDLNAHTDGKSEIYENIHRMKHKNGEWLYIRDHGIIVNRDIKDEPVRFIGTHSDITEQWKSELQVFDARKARDHFFSMMNHEIRTPLGGMLISLSLLSEETLNPEQKKLTNLIIQNGTLLENLVDDILEVSKLNDKKIKYKKKTFNLEEAVSEVVALFSKQCEERKNEVIVNYLPKGKAYIGDVYRIKQVLNSLLSNANKFTEKGKITIELTYVKGAIKLTVTDTGIGVDPEGISEIFLPFSQIDSSRTRKYSGTGLGLYISKNICEQMEGDLTVSSVINEGASFSATFPLEISNELDKKILPLKDIVISEKAKSSLILIVEDNEVNSTVLKMLLNKRGFEKLEIVENGKLACDFLENNHCDLILMDCMMPVMDGYEATKQIKNNEKTAHIPIIAVTASALDTEIEYCLNVGMNDVLLKPIKIIDLIQMLEKHLS